MIQEDQEKNLDNLLAEESEEKESEKTEGEEEEEKEEKEEEKFVMPEKFKGKSAEEIAKSYSELEKMIEKKAEEKAQELLNQRKEEEEGEEEEEEIKPPLTSEEKPNFSEMTPEQFADWVIQEIERRTEQKSRTIFEESIKVKESVAAEIAAVQEDYPALKTNNEYRELVLSLIESAAQKGEVLSLEDACKKVEAVIGGKKEIEKEEEEKLKKAKAIVEKGAGTPAMGPSETEEERIKEALLGGKSTSSLGGLGI